jgi:hypothetical protein
MDEYVTSNARFVEIKNWLDTQRELRSRIVNGVHFANEDNNAPFTLADLQGIISGMNMNMPYTAEDIYWVLHNE